MAREANPERTAEREAKFKELAPKRVNKVLKGIAGVANLASPQYKSTDQQRQKIVKAIRTELDKLESVFAGEKKADAGFSLDEEEAASQASDNNNE